MKGTNNYGKDMSPSTRKVWIEILLLYSNRQKIAMSPSTRKVWIEILYLNNTQQLFVVTFQTEGVV